MRELIKVAKISSGYGLKGAFKIEYVTDGPEDFLNYGHLYVFGYSEPLQVEDCTIKKSSVYLKLKGIDTIDRVEELIGSFIYIDEDQIKELDEDEFRHNDLIGLDVITENGVHVGTVSDVVNGNVQDLLEITDGKDTALVPFVSKFFGEIELENKCIRISPIEGLIPWL